jgi:hypothetical protein
MDKSQTRSVVVYDTSGHFVGLISKQGKGPEEYIQLTDIFIDPDDNTLNVVSRIDKKILKYDITGNRLLEVKKTPKSFTRLSKMKDGYVGYMGNYGEDGKMPYNIWTMSPDMKLENHFFDIARTWESIKLGDGSVFSTYNGNTNFITPMDYNIYHIEKDRVTVPYTFDLGKTEWPAEYKDHEQVTKMVNKSRYILRFYNFQETPNHFIVHVLYGGQYLLGVYNKQSSVSHIARLEPYMDKYFFSFGQIIGFDEDTIYTLVDASDIKRMWNGKDQYNDYESKYPEQIKRLREKFPRVSEDGNPFLVMYHIN